MCVSVCAREYLCVFVVSFGVGVRESLWENMCEYEGGGGDVV